MLEYSTTTPLTADQAREVVADVGYPEATVQETDQGAISVRVGQITDAGLHIVREELHVTSTVRRLPATLGRWLGASPLTQNALISNMEYVLAHG